MKKTMYFLWVFLVLLIGFSCAQVPTHDYNVRWDLNQDNDPNYTDTFSYVLYIVEITDPAATPYVDLMEYEASLPGIVGEYLHASFSDSGHTIYESELNGKYLHALLFARSETGIYSPGAISNICKKENMLRPRTPVIVELKCGD